MEYFSADFIDKIMVNMYQVMLSTLHWLFYILTLKTTYMELFYFYFTDKVIETLGG